MARHPLYQRRESKYHAKPTVVDGIRFASHKEARRFSELKLLEKAGQIHQLTLQKRFPLLAPAANAPSGCLLQRVGEYVADFVYCACQSGINCGKEGVVEDVKGVRTQIYRWKKRHFEIQYGIMIREI